MALWIFNHIELLLEIIAVIFGIIYVIFAARNNVWCWIFGIFASLISVFLFAIYAKLYAEAFLYFFYVIAGIYGWIVWKNKENKNELHTYSLKINVLLFIVGSFISIGLYFILFYLFKDAQKPLIDSFTTVFSFIATYLTAKKIIENWIYWIVIDLITAYLYYSRELYIYAVLMFIYSFIAIYGYLQWQKRIAK